MAKVNYQYEKRQKELQKKRKKEQKLKLKQIKKDGQFKETPAVDVQIETPAQIPAKPQDGSTES